MTTPATARELAKLLDKMGDLHAQMALINLADQVDTLTKERDEYRATAEELVPSLLEQVRNQQAEITRLQYEVDAIPVIKAERDALTLANKDLSNWFDALRIDHDALMKAGKLATDALKIAQNNLASSRCMLGGHTTLWDRYSEAITTLKQAGVS